jgi:hypothetical protein
MVRNVETWFYHPDTEMGWIRPAAKMAANLCAEQRPAVIWTTAGPVSSFVVAEKVSKHSGVPYVLDFRDSWTITYNEFEDRRPRWAKRLAERSMYRLLENAQSIIFRYHTEAECYWRAYTGAFNPAKVYIIPNGFEGAIEEFAPRRSAKCEILYTGTVSDYGYDSLLQALACLKDSCPALAGHLHLRFIGEGSEAVADAAAMLNITDLITCQRPGSHQQVNQLTKDAHALLILGRPATMRGHELFAGAKLFGYLKTGMPIIGVLPADETKNILRGVGVTTLADVDSVSGIVEVLRQVIVAWLKGELLSLVPSRRACDRYSADQQTRELVRALEGRPAIEGFVPGSTEVPASLRSIINKRTAEHDRTEWFAHPARGE